MVTNTGGRDVVIGQIAVRGQAAPWTNVLYAIAATDEDITTDLTYITTPVAVTNDLGLTRCCTPSNHKSSLAVRSTIVIYINNPDSISLNDIGLTVGIAVHSAQAVYYSEVNIQAVSPYGIYYYAIFSLVFSSVNWCNFFYAQGYLSRNRILSLSRS